MSGLLGGKNSMKGCPKTSKTRNLETEKRARAEETQAESARKLLDGCTVRKTAAGTSGESEKSWADSLAIIGPHAACLPLCGANPRAGGQTFDGAIPDRGLSKGTRQEC
jgi:hypothetical protein